MSEDKNLCTQYKYHKHKIILTLSAMRNYASDLKKTRDVFYFELSEQSFFENLLKTIKENNFQKIMIHEILDSFFEEEFRNFCQFHQIPLEFLPSQSFINPLSDFSEYLQTVKKPFLKTYYQRQRIKHKILIDSQNKPLGGQWSYDEDNRKALPLDIKIPHIKWDYSSHDPILEDVKKIVDVYFSDHPGNSENFFWPNTRALALKALEDFCQHRFHLFGPYEDALTNKSHFVFHSGLSPLMNIGLITPQEVIDTILSIPDIPMSSREGFIRQVIGWREFIFGIYKNFKKTLENSNTFSHTSLMTKDWYQGTLGIPLVDEAIKQAQNIGYCHHIQRLMVLSNTMLLCRIDPKEVYKWFMEMFVDAAEWVMYPNVYGMGQGSDGGIFATKPYICGSNYLLKMSGSKPKERLPWMDIMDGLYWKFMSDYKDIFIKNPRMSVMYRQNLSSDKYLKLFELAENFIHKVTFEKP